jgi:hypothetical protein
LPCRDSDEQVIVGDAAISGDLLDLRQACCAEYTRR